AKAAAPSAPALCRKFWPKSSPDPLEKAVAPRRGLFLLRRFADSVSRCIPRAAPPLGQCVPWNAEKKHPKQPCPGHSAAAKECRNYDVFSTSGPTVHLPHAAFGIQ
ncbi:MAG: hypothetical protein ACO37E_08400, partial [Lutimaribacter sp.]